LKLIFKKLRLNRLFFYVKFVQNYSERRKRKKTRRHKRLWGTNAKARKREHLKTLPFLNILRGTKDIRFRLLIRNIGVFPRTRENEQELFNSSVIIDQVIGNSGFQKIKNLLVIHHARVHYLNFWNWGDCCALGTWRNEFGNSY